MRRESESCPVIDRCRGPGWVCRIQNGEKERLSGMVMGRYEKEAMWHAGRGCSDLLHPVEFLGPGLRACNGASLFGGRPVVDLDGRRGPASVQWPADDLPDFTPDNENERHAHNETPFPANRRLIENAMV